MSRPMLQQQLEDSLPFEAAADVAVLMLVVMRKLMTGTDCQHRMSRDLALDWAEAARAYVGDEASSFECAKLRREIQSLL